MLKSALSFRGRVDRHDYARFALLSWIALNAVAALGAAPMHVLDASYPVRHLPAALLAITIPSDVAGVLVIVGLILVLAIGYLLLSLSVRRFHDVNLSGWYILLWTIVLAFVPDRNLGDYLPSITDLIWYAVLVTVPGSAGANRYGPSPAGSPDAGQAAG